MTELSDKTEKLNSAYEVEAKCAKKRGDVIKFAAVYKDKWNDCSEEDQEHFTSLSVSGVSSFQGFHGGKLISNIEASEIEDSFDGEDEYRFGWYVSEELRKVITIVREFEPVEAGKIFKIKSKKSWDTILATNKKVVVHFSFANEAYGTKVSFNNDIIKEFEEKYKHFVKTTTKTILFAVVYQDNWRTGHSREDLEHLKSLYVSALSSFHGYHGGRLIAKTEETFEIEDLEMIISKISEPKKNVPYKGTVTDYSMYKTYVECCLFFGVEQNKSIIKPLLEYGSEIETFVDTDEGANELLGKYAVV